MQKLSWCVLVAALLGVAACSEPSTSSDTVVSAASVPTPTTPAATPAVVAADDSTAAAASAFAGLQSIRMGEDANMPDFEIWYRPDLGAVDAESSKDEWDMPNHRLANVRLNEQDTTYELMCNEDPSADPHCDFYQIGPQGRQEVGTLDGNLFYLPGNGFIYADSSSNRYHRERSKWQLKNGRLTEVKQPFYYVGLDTHANAALTLTAQAGGGQTVANIPAGGKLTVLLRDHREGERQHFLVKTEFGLTGWVALDGSDLVPGKGRIEGIFYHGD